ncbi:MAG: hypothetical protein R3A11_08515 [Bdellovibrionota bacterium]
MNSLYQKACFVFLVCGILTTSPGARAQTIDHAYTYEQLEDAFYKEPFLKVIIDSVGPASKSKQNVFAYDVSNLQNPIQVVMSGQHQALATTQSRSEAKYESGKEFVRIPMQLGVDITYNLAAIRGEITDEDLQNSDEGDENTVVAANDDLITVTLLCNVEELYDVSYAGSYQPEALIKVYPDLKGCKGSVGLRLKIVKAMKQAGKLPDDAELPFVYQLSATPNFVLAEVECKSGVYKHGNGKCYILEK